MKKIDITLFLFFVICFPAFAQQGNNSQNNEPFDIQKVPISNAELGKFPYIKTFPGFKPTNYNDSVTIAQNQTFFYDGKRFFAIEGKVSSQKLSLYSNDKLSEFQMIQDFDRMVNVLGGKKIFTGVLPIKQLKPLAGTDDEIALSASNSIVQFCYYGVVEYVIKTPKKEVWIQFQPYSIGSNFYSLLVVEKQVELMTTNTNNKNEMIHKLLNNEMAIFNLKFKTDNTEIQTESREELLKIVNIYQQYPNWKLKLELHSPPVGKPEYILGLTQRRADEIKKQLLALGVKSTQLEIKGMGDTKPKVPNENEQSRIENNRIEVYKL